MIKYSGWTLNWSLTLSTFYVRYTDGSMDIFNTDFLRFGIRKSRSRLGIIRDTMKKIKPALQNELQIHCKLI